VIVLQYFIVATLAGVEDSVIEAGAEGFDNQEMNEQEFEATQRVQTP